jgi:hypothetical protein
MEPRSPDPVLLFCGLLAASKERLDLSIKDLSTRFGPLLDRSPLLPWNFSHYYEKEIGKPLLRQFVFFEKKISPDRLAGIKRETIGMESSLSETREGKQCRTINIDPGYLAPAKVVLATAKDFAHRIYLSDGIYAEVTLLFLKNRFTPLPHTYPDFRSESYIEIFNNARKWIMTSAGEK